MELTDRRVFFTDHQWRTVEAATARIIPTDHDPGAREANVVGFIDRYLCGIDYVYANPQGSGFLRLEGKPAEAWSKRIAQVQARYQEGLKRLDQLSAGRFGSVFADLAEEQQDSVLRVLAGGESQPATGGAANGAPDAAHMEGGYEVAMSQPVTDEELGLFETLVLHTRCGFYSDPAYGGNKDYAGWETIGFPGPRSLAETNDGRYSTLEYMTGGEYEMPAVQQGGVPREAPAPTAPAGAAATGDQPTDAAEPGSNGRPPGVVEARTLGLAGAWRVIYAAVDFAFSRGGAVCVAVVDRAGHLLGYVRMDGAPLLTGQFAQDKAYTVAAFGVPTHEWWGMVGEAPEIFRTVIKADRVSFVAGGVPILHRGELVGAIGVSGGTAEDDRKVAEAGAKAYA